MQQYEFHNVSKMLYIKMYSYQYLSNSTGHEHQLDSLAKYTIEGHLDLPKLRFY